MVSEEQGLGERLSENELSISGKVRDVDADVVTIKAGSAEAVEARVVNVAEGGVADASADSIQVERGGIARAEAASIRVEQGGIGLAKADTVQVTDGCVLGASAGKAQLEQTSVAFLAARSVDGEARVLFDLRAAVLFGAVVGVVLGLFRLVRKRFL